MDAYILAMEVGGAEFNLEIEKDMDEEETKEDIKKGDRPNPNFLKLQLQIHNDDMVSNFWEATKDDKTAASGTPIKNIPQSPNEFTPSILSGTTLTTLLPEVLQQLSKLINDTIN